MFSPFILAGCFQVGLSNITITLNNVKGEKKQNTKIQKKNKLQKLYHAKRPKKQKKGFAMAIGAGNEHNKRNSFLHAWIKKGEDCGLLLTICVSLARTQLKRPRQPQLPLQR